MTFGEWYESHKEDSDEWYIGFLTGWVYIGLPKDCINVLRTAIQQAYVNDLENHMDSARLLVNVERYCDNLTRSLKKLSKQIKDAGLYANEVEDVVKLLDGMVKTQSNIHRHLQGLRATVKEPIEPLPLEETEIKEQYLSCKGMRCLTLQGSIPGNAWDKEEYAKWIQQGERIIYKKE